MRLGVWGPQFAGTQLLIRTRSPAPISYFWKHMTDLSFFFHPSDRTLSTRLSLGVKSEEQSRILLAQQESSWENVDKRLRRVRVVGILTARLILYSLSKLKAEREVGSLEPEVSLFLERPPLRRHRYRLSDRDNGLFVTDLIREELHALWRTWRWWWCWCAVRKSLTAQTLGKYTSIILTTSFVTDENHMEQWAKKIKK